MGKIHKQFGALPIAGVALKTKNKESLGDIMFVHMSWGGAWAFEKIYEVLRECWIQYIRC